jgi:hypothetical protein
MAKRFIELIRDDIRRARAGENILTEEPAQRARERLVRVPKTTVRPFLVGNNRPAH